MSAAGGRPWARQGAVVSTIPGAAVAQAAAHGPLATGAMPAADGRCGGIEAWTRRRAGGTVESEGTPGTARARARWTTVSWSTVACRSGCSRNAGTESGTHLRCGRGARLVAVHPDVGSITERAGGVTGPMSLRARGEARARRRVHVLNAGAVPVAGARGATGARRLTRRATPARVARTQTRPRDPTVANALRGARRQRTTRTGVGA